MTFPLPGFPGAGVGQVNGLADATGIGAALQVTADNAATAGGFLLYSILAELRIHTIYLQVLANIPTDNLAQMRQDIVNDMGTLYVANAPTPVLSS